MCRFIRLAILVIASSCPLSRATDRLPIVGPDTPKAAVTLERPVYIETLGGLDEVIPSGVALPLKHSEIYGNGHDNQKAIQLNLVQKHDKEIEPVAALIIDGLPPRPKGVLQVIITVSVDEKKQLRIKATVTEANYQKEFGPFSIK